MNAIVKNPLRGEIIPPGEGITLIVATHPLAVTHERRTAPAGLTIAELVELGRGGGASRLRSRFVCWIGRDRIAEALWGRVRPKPGTIVLLRAVPEFGGDNSLLRSILTLAVVGLGVVLAPIIAPAIGLSVGLVGAGITIAGQLAINALFPIAAPQLGSSAATSQSYSISGGSNQADPYGVVPSHLGKNRYYPKLGARNYTEFDGSDQYLRMLLVWGYAPPDISDIKIGETPIGDFDDVEIETRLGYADDAPVTLYPNEVLQDDLSIELTAEAGWQQRTTATAIDEVSVDIVAPAGIVRIDDQGQSQNYTVSVRAEYRASGSSDAWALLGTLDLTSRSSDAIRKTIRLAVANGQYDVRVEKTSSDSNDDHVSEQVVWTALRGTRNTPPISFAQPVAVTALRIRATSQLNGVVDDLNAIVQARVTAFDGSGWVAGQLSRNPADLFRHVLQGPANSRPQPDSRIDIETLQQWGAYCAAQGFTFDMVRDFSASVYETLGDITAAGRAARVFRDGKWSVVWDEADAPIVQHFTPRNSWGFSGHRTYVQTPHAFRVRFVNAENGYQQDERVVYDDGYNAGNATLFEQVEFPGVTDPAIIWRMARYQIAQARLRPEIYSLSVDVEHIVATRGDRVRVTHDVPMWGLVSGRVKAVAGATVTLDEPLTMEEGKSYAIRFRLADGSSLLRAIETDPGAQTTVTLTGAGSGTPAPGDLFMAGGSGEESVVLRILSITPGEDLSAQVKLVDDAPEIADADTGTIPDFDSHISTPPDIRTAKPINLQLHEGYQGTGDNSITGVFFSWDTLAGDFPVSFEAQFADHDGDGLFKPAGTVPAPKKQVFISDYQAGHWDFRVRSIYADTTCSDWALLGDQPLAGGAIVPRQVAEGSVSIFSLSRDLQAIQGIVTGPGGIAAQLAEIKARQAAQAAANIDDQATNKEKTDALIVQSGDNAAAIVTEQEARAERDAALATQITEVEANVGNHIADGFLRFDATVDGGGSVATITAKAKATAGSAFSEAAWILRAEADGSGGTNAYFGVQGTIYAFPTDGSAPVPAIVLDPNSGTVIGARILLGASGGAQIDINANGGDPYIEITAAP